MLEFISVHIAKTAGSSFLHVLHQVLGQENVLNDYTSENCQLNESLPAHIQAIHGHFYAEKYISHFPKAKWIVWLRHPIFRLLSEYFFAQILADPHNPVHVRLTQEKLTLLEFADQPEIRNVQFNQIQGKRLVDFYFVGLQEFYLEDLVDLRNKADWAELTVGCNNTNPHPNYYQYMQDMLSKPSVLKQLVAWNRDDMELYQEALSLRSSRRQELMTLQCFLSGLQQTQPLIQHLQTKLNQLEVQLQKDYKPAMLLETIQFNNSRVLEDLLGFSVDSPHSGLEVFEEVTIQGWAIGRQGKAITLKVWSDNQVLAETPINLYRPDVAKEHPVLNAEQSGFQVKVFVAGMAENSELFLQVLLENQIEIDIAIIRFTRSVPVS